MPVLRSSATLDPAPAANRVRRTAYLTIVVLLLAWTIDFVDRFAISMAMPFIGEEFGLSKTMQGLLFTTFSVVYLLCQVPAGYLADRFGARGLMLTTLVLWSAFTGLTGLMGTFAGLLAVRALFGASQGCFPPASFKAVAERTTPKNRGTVTGVVMSASGFGPGIAPLIVAPLIAAAGWRSSFLWLAACGAAIGVLLWALLPRPLPAALTRAVDAAGRTTTASRREVLRSLQVWKFAALFCAMNLLVSGLVSWVPSYLLESRNLSIQTTGVLAAIPMLVTVGTTILGGWLFDRFFHDRIRWFLVPIVAVTAIFLALMLTASSAVQFTVYETIALGVASLGSMCLFGLPMRVLPTEHAGIGMGMLNLGGQVAAAIAPLLMGWLVDRFSYTAAFGLLVATTAVGAVIACWLPQRPAQFGFSTTAAQRRDDGADGVHRGRSVDAD
ncbi:MFS transporter [Saccharopolyspora subtropica]|uniref:MFS transporter n=1 Tax=Saccharopolyspora thermophila TaxID=89367 RepID=A0A917N9R5_9PSEU|nr:MFS transporter [Saccharopolyspora subtropica]GGI80469.1 MFS transporter [Saccharopolyspora subtropica]